MKKLFGFLTLFIILNITTVYFFLFTTYGNGIVADIVENKVNEKGVVEFKINEFKLTTNTINFKATIDSNSMIYVGGGLNLLGKTVDLKYNVDIKDLSKLEKFSNQKLNGALSASGTVKGNQELTVIDGISDIFSSKTNYVVNLKDFEPDTIKLKIKGAKIDTLLHTVNQPIFAKGFIDITGDIKGAKPENFDGEIITNIYDGKVNLPIVNKNFNLKLKKALNFKGDIVTSLEPYQLVSKADVFTSLANVFAKKAVVDIKESSVKTDYQVKIANLNNLYELTNTKMRGSLLLDGTVSKTKDLVVTGTSNLFAGKVDFKLKNDDFSTNVNNVDLRSLTHMLFYPEIFNSKANAVLNYNLKTSQGTLTADLKNGQFIKNKFSTLVNQLARFDLTKEVYEVVNLNSKINKEIINSTVDMKSKHTNIQVPNSTLNSKKKTIDALVKVDIKGLKFDANVNGSLDNPKVKIDSKKLLQSGAKQKVMEKIKGSDKAKDLLKKLNLF